MWQKSLLQHDGDGSCSQNHNGWHTLCNQQRLIEHYNYYYTMLR